jgi:Universal stress protein family
LLKNGNLAGLQYEFIIREGNVWEQLEFIIQEKHIDAVVVGTHRREGLGRLMLGSVAEQIFRQANCLVLTVGPGSQFPYRKKGEFPSVLVRYRFQRAFLGGVAVCGIFRESFRRKT